MRAWDWITFAVGWIICLGLLASCGGYGMGGYTAPPPMGTVAFTSPGQTGAVTYGQSLKLSWTTTNVVSCTASTSSAIGGNFSGSQAVTGSMTVVPTGAGTVTYTMSCVSGTGMGSYGMMTTGATVSAMTTVTVN